MKAAIYARKSTDDNDKHEDNKSVTRQRERAIAYAEAKGWTVDAEHIFEDDGISGFEFKKRPGLIRLLTHLKQFDVIVMSELSRLGREQGQNAQALASIIAKGVKVYFYLTDEELKYETAVDKFMVNAVSFAAELEREKAAQRSLDALERKARKGYNAGGACYGYDNLPIFSTNSKGESTKSHTDYRINPAESAVINGIFRMYAAGTGHTTIAWTLNGNAEYAAHLKRHFGGIAPPSPKQGKRGSGSWAPSSIRSILYNVRYTGKVPFRAKKQEPPILTDRPDLRIIDEALWTQVQTRLKAVATNYVRDGGHWWGRPSTEKYLLTGNLKCGVCGGNITIIGGQSGQKGKRKAISYYGCARHHTRGHTVCTNDTRVRLERLEARVIEALEKTVLVPAAALYVVETAMTLAEQQLKQNPGRPREIEAELKKLRRELKHLTAAIAEGKAPKSLLTEIASREARIEALLQEQEELAHLPGGLTDLDRARLRKSMLTRMDRLKELLRTNTACARQVLQKTLSGPLRCLPALDPDGRKTLALEGTTRLGPLLEPEFYTSRASPRGFEPRSPP